MRVFMLPPRALNHSQNRLLEECSGDIRMQRRRNRRRCVVLSSFFARVIRGRTHEQSPSSAHVVSGSSQLRRTGCRRRRRGRCRSHHLVHEQALNETVVDAIVPHTPPTGTGSSKIGRAARGVEHLVRIAVPRRAPLPFGALLREEVACAACCRCRRVLRTGRRRPPRPGLRQPGPPQASHPHAVSQTTGLSVQTAGSRNALRESARAARDRRRSNVRRTAGPARSRQSWSLGWSCSSLELDGSAPVEDEVPVSVDDDTLSPTLKTTRSRRSTTSSPRRRRRVGLAVVAPDAAGARDGDENRRNDPTHAYDSSPCVPDHARVQADSLHLGAVHHERTTRRCSGIGEPQLPCVAATLVRMKIARWLVAGSTDCPSPERVASAYGLPYGIPDVSAPPGRVRRKADARRRRRPFGDRRRAGPDGIAGDDPETEIFWALRTTASTGCSAAASTTNCRSAARSASPPSGRWRTAG